MITLSYTVSTPAGPFEANWDEDEAVPVQYTGDSAAIAYFAAHLKFNHICGNDGYRLDAATLEPDDLIRFCQPDGSGVRVVNPGIDLLPQDNEEDMSMGAMLDAVSDAQSFQLIGEGAQLLRSLDEDSATFFADLGRLREIVTLLGDDATVKDGSAVGHGFAVGDFLTAKFARLNKQGTLAEYIRQVNQGGHSTEICKVEKVLSLSNEAYDELANNLLKNRPDLGGGGVASDAPFDFNFNRSLSDWPEEERSAWEKTSYRLVTVVDAPDRQPFVTDKQGYDYARYAGVELRPAEDPMKSFKTNAKAPAVKRVTKKEAREAFDTLSYRVNDLKGHTPMEFVKADVPGRLEPAMKAVRELVARGWPDGEVSPDRLLEMAQGQIDSWKQEKEAGGPTEMGRGDAINYLRNAGLSQAQIDAVLASPTSVRKTEANSMLGSITIPSYSRAYLDAEIAKASDSASSNLASIIDGIRTRFTIFNLPLDVPAGGVVMNAPRPLLGTKTAEGDFLSGRFYAAIDPADSMAEKWAEENKKLDGLIALYATMDEQILMALNLTKYKSRYLDLLADGEDVASIKGMMRDVQDRPYREAVAMLEAARKELAGRTIKQLADQSKEPDVPQPEQVAAQEGEAQSEEVPPATDPQRAEDDAFLASVMNGTADMLDEGFAERLEAIYARWESDPEMSAKVTEAVSRYAEFAVSD